MALESFSTIQAQSFFCWLLLKDRISTRGLLKRNGMILPSYSFMCPLSTGYRRKSGSFVSSVSLFTTVLAAHPFTDLLTTGSFLNLIRLQITTQCLILYGYHHYNHYNLYVYIQFDRMLWVIFFSGASRQKETLNRLHMWTDLNSFTRKSSIANIHARKLWDRAEKSNFCETLEQIPL